MAKNQKRDVYVRFTEADIDFDFDYVELDTVIKNLTDIKAEFDDKGFTRLFFTLEYRYGCYHDCDCSKKLTLNGIRPETDEEFKARRLEEKNAKKATEERERKEFERLKQKFGE